MLNAGELLIPASSVTQDRKKEEKNIKKYFELGSRRNTNSLKPEKQKLYKLWNQIYLGQTPGPYHKLFDTQNLKNAFFEHTGGKHFPGLFVLVMGLSSFPMNMRGNDMCHFQAWS